MTQRELAIYTAGYAHKDQMYGESPYLFHLDAADKVLADAGYKAEELIRISVWLHDTLEDTELPESYLEKTFGPIVTSLVKAVTNDPGENRKVRAEKTYPKIKSCLFGAVDLKLADRIANIEQSNRTFSRYGLMYLKEHPEFYKGLYPDSFWELGLQGEYLWKRYKSAIADVLSRVGLKGVNATL